MAGVAELVTEQCGRLRRIVGADGEGGDGCIDHVFGGVVVLVGPRSGDVELTRALRIEYRRTGI